MKKNRFATQKGFSMFKITSLFVFVVFMSIGAFADDASNAQIARAEKMHDRYQERLEVADSLINRGDTIRERTSIEIRQATDRMHERVREYKKNRRGLERQMGEVPRQEITEYRLAIRNLDDEYRQELRDYDEFMREVIRESEIWTHNYERGLEIRREAQRGLREAASLLDNLKQNLAEESGSQEDVASNK